MLYLSEVDSQNIEDYNLTQKELSLLEEKQALRVKKESNIVL